MSFKVPSWLRDVAGFVTKAIESATPDQHAQLTDTATKLHDLAQSVEGLMPTIVKLAVDTMLVAIGWGKYAPDANGILDMLAAEIMSRKSAPKVA